MYSIEGILKEARWIKKVAQEESFIKEFRRYRILLNKLKRKDSIKKLELLFVNPRVRRPDIYWARKLDKTEVSGSADFENIIKNIRFILKRNLPIASFLKKILDYGLSKGHVGLNRVLTKNRIKFDILKQKKPVEIDESLTSETTKTEFDNVTKNLKEKEHALFGKEPSAKEVQELREKDPVAYKEFSKIKREKNKAYKDVRTSIFVETKQKELDTDEYKSKMKILNMDPKIDEGFVGKIGVDGKLKTGTGKHITALLGRNVKMNREYDEASDNTFYCTSINSNNNLVHHYTENFMLRNKKEKYLKNQKFGNVIEDMRDKINEDLDSSDKKVQTTALMTTLVDQAYFRIGNAASEKKNVRGLHNLQVRHLKIDDQDRLHFRYVGKDKIHQHKIVADEKITKLVKDLIAGKSSNDYIFSFTENGKSKRIKPGDVNDYMKGRLESPVTIHKFRTYHSTRLAKEMLGKVKIDPKVTKMKVMKAFKKSVDKIAKFMGHSSLNTTVKHYIDTSVLQSFFSRFIIEPPKIIANMMAVASFDGILKIAQDDFIPVVSDKTITSEEEQFNEWMETLPPKIMENKGIEITGKVDEEEKYFI